MPQGAAFGRCCQGECAPGNAPRASSPLNPAMRRQEASPWIVRAPAACSPRWHMHVVGDAAIASMAAESRGTYRGKPMSEKSCGVGFFVKRDGRWQVDLRAPLSATSIQSARPEKPVFAGTMSISLQVTGAGLVPATGQRSWDARHVLRQAHLRRLTPSR
jgi:hypothetical protein